MKIHHLFFITAFLVQSADAMVQKDFTLFNDTPYDLYVWIHWKGKACKKRGRHRDTDKGQIPFMQMAPHSRVKLKHIDAFCYIERIEGTRVLEDGATSGAYNFTTDTPLTLKQSKAHIFEYDKHVSGSYFIRSPGIRVE